MLLRLLTALALAAPAAAATPAPAPAKAPFSAVKLAGSGATLYGMADGRLPRVWYHLYLEAGERFTPARLAGLTSVATEVLDRGPAGIPYATYQRDLFRQNAEIRWEAGNRFLIAHVKCAPEQLGAITALVKRTALSPRLDAASFADARGVVVNQRTALNDDMRSITFVYGKQKAWDFRPESRAPEGWVESLSRITAPDLAGYLSERLAHPAAFIAASAPMPPAKLGAALAPALAGWVRPFDGRRTPMPTERRRRQVVLIDKPGATDNQIYMLTALPLDPTSREEAAAEVFFAGMGLDLGARLGKALRVERGLTYHAGAGVRRAEWPQWYAYSFGGITQTPKLVSGIFELFGAAAPGLTPEEVAIAKDKLLQGEATDMETPPEQIAAVATAVGQGLPPETPFRRPALIAAVTPDEVKGPAATAAALDAATIVVMGDASKIQAPLAAALPPGTPLVVRTFAELAPEALGERAPEPSATP